MSGRSADSLAPSSTLALYLCALVAVYVIQPPMLAIAASLAFCVAALIGVRLSGAAIPRGRWRGGAVFVAWVFIMKIALDVAGGASIHDAAPLLAATRQAARVGFLIVGALSVVAAIPARAVVEELETTRLPRSARLLVMMLVQYPRVLRDRYEQIVEAQVARGADRPRSVVQRVVYGVRILLPVMQSELNAIGERAGLIHLRRLDVDVVVTDAARQGPFDFFARSLGIALVIIAIATRIFIR